MQHYYASHNAYADTPSPQLPFASTPRQGAASYAITVGVPASDPTTFVLTATRTGTMSSDACGDFTYDNLGVPRNAAIPANLDSAYADMGLCG